MTQTKPPPPPVGHASRVRGAVRFMIVNADTTVSLAVAVAFLALSIVGRASVEELVAGALLVLVLLCFSGLRDREQRDRLLGLMRRIDGDVTSVQRAFRESRQLHVSKDQDADNARFGAIIEELASITHADFLAFSGRDARPFVEQVLQSCDCRVRLLLKHPDTVGHVQQQWILAELLRMQAYLIPRFPGRFDMRCYRSPYSLRGRKLEPHVIEVGWYTPLVGDPVEVVGHRNPLITAHLDTAEGAALARMFDDVFEALWNAKDTEDGASVVGRQG